MSLIYGVPEMAEEEVLEQIAFQAVQYLRLDDPKYKKADTLSKILVAAKDKPKEDEIVYIEALESIIGENGSYKDLGDAKIVDKSWDTEGTQFNRKSRPQWCFSPGHCGRKLRSWDQTKSCVLPQST